MAQLLLDPKHIQSTGPWVPQGPLPEAVRNFGYVPDFSALLPGDLLLFCPLAPDWVSRQIQKAQRRGGYHTDDARWTHAAVYLGDGADGLCEATTRRVRTAEIFKYIPDHLVRVRRAPNLSVDERYRIALRALFRLRTNYGFGFVVSLFFRSFAGFWKGSKKPYSRLGLGSVVCSQLYADSYAIVTQQMIAPRAAFDITPAALSDTSTLLDVQVSWKQL